LCSSFGRGFEPLRLHKTVLSVSLESRDERLAPKNVLSLNTLAHTHTFTMFDFEKLTVYSKAKEFNIRINHFLLSTKLDKTTNDQLRRASFSILLNIAEGTGRFTKPDRKNFFIISRGSTFECVAILDYLKDIESISQTQFDEFYQELDELSRMLFAMIKNLS
jgi:four helix bundle protein